ncbi:hypothetical protein [Achromobacter pulmonis]|uniref:hypothetical protein n=1 Tax=Achromobacter pulmonis TaxID=1389932 RepID=UPI0015E870A1|nr:hypothetical protein [Achromobacter pulmonis]
MEIQEKSRAGKGSVNADVKAPANETGKQLGDAIAAAAADGRVPRVGFVSLGCP